MADVITDNRTLISTMDVDTNVVDEAGAAYSSIQSEYFVEGTGCSSDKFAMGTGGMGYNMTTPTDFSATHFYIWWACATPGKLQTQANGGVRIRFCGATVTDWFEVYVAGSDTYTGGFVMSVIDIVTARANAVAGTLGGVNGTTPAVTAIQYIMVFWDVPGSVAGNTDNCYLDAMWYLPATTPGIIVEGRNGGTADWTWDDIRNASDNADPTKAWGVFKDAGNGTYSCNTPIQFGVNDATTHGFSDTLVVVGFENQLVASDFYGLSVIGGSGIQNFDLGVVAGSGNDRVGSQGCTITADATGERWFFDCDDVNIDACNLYGCTFLHGSDFQFDSATVQTVSTFFVDCNSAIINNSLFLRNSIIAANTADDVVFLTVDDLNDVLLCSFSFSDGHAIELTDNTVDPQTLTGCSFNGYGVDTSTDAAIYYNYGVGTLSVNILDGSLPTYKDGTGATTTQSSSVSVQITVLDNTNTGIEFVQTSIYLASDNSEVINLDTNASGIASGSYTGATPANVYWRCRKGSPGDTKYIKQSGVGVIAASTGFAITVTLIEDPNNNS